MSVRDCRQSSRQSLTDKRSPSGNFGTKPELGSYDGKERKGEERRVTHENRFSQGLFSFTPTFKIPHQSRILRCASIWSLFGVSFPPDKGVADGFIMTAKSSQRKSF